MTQTTYNVALLDCPSYFISIVDFQEIHLQSYRFVNNRTSPINSEQHDQEVHDSHSIFYVDHTNNENLYAHYSIFPLDFVVFRAICFLITYQVDECI